ncbi:hypothetical protein KKF84_02545 [Myxococcota bacterium]|nr:hypothetical protein [Myxococcota bacterium]MBU1534168.1 hypothetical protein [Myxococcota bacterium]
MKNPTLFIFAVIFGGFLCLACDDDSSSTTNNENNNNFTSLTPDNILDACLIRDACEVLNGGYISPCVTAHYDQVEQQHTQPIWNDLYRCVLKTGGVCSEVEKCFGNGILPQSCDPNTQKGYCDGSIRYYCDSFSGTMYAMDCGEAGYECVVGYDGNTACTEAACDDSTFEVACNGTLMRVCDNGYINTTDCGVLGLDCVRGEIEEGVFKLFCMGDGGQCDAETYVPTCDGPNKVTCDQGVVTTIDCTALPGDKMCVPPEDETDIPRCNPAGQECEEGEEYCLDSFVARICIDGYFYDRDCTELGFTRCTGLGVNHDIGAHCTH